MDLPIEIDCKSLQTLWAADANVVVLDCREQKEYDVVRIAGAELVPMSEIAQRLDELAAWRDRRVVVHCHHGGRSLRVATWLRQQGFTQAQSLAGGIDAWAVEIDPSLPRY